MTLERGELGSERGGQRSGEHRLAHAWHVFDQEVAPRQGGDHGDRHRAGCAQEDPLEVGV